MAKKKKAKKAPKKLSVKKPKRAAGKKRLGRPPGKAKVKEVAAVAKEVPVNRTFVKKVVEELVLVNRAIAELVDIVSEMVKSQQDHRDFGQKLKAPCVLTADEKTVLLEDLMLDVNEGHEEDEESAAPEDRLV